MELTAQLPIRRCTEGDDDFMYRGFVNPNGSMGKRHEVVDQLGEFIPHRIEDDPRIDWV